MIRFMRLLIFVCGETTPMSTEKMKNEGAKITARLTAIRKRVGAPLGDFSAVDIQIDGGKLREWANAHPNQPIIIGGRLGIAYIKDHCHPYYHDKKKVHAQITADHPNGCYTRSNKVHFYYCSTLRRMEKHGRKKRYRVVNKFGNTQKIDLADAPDVSSRLLWCKLCTERFQHDWSRAKKNEDQPPLSGGLSHEKDDNARGMSLDHSQEGLSVWFTRQAAEWGEAKVIKGFINPNNPFWKDFISGLDSPASPSNYPRDWSKRSKAFRKKQGYKCAVCGVDCAEYPYLTDAHHKNGIKSDCDDSNLQCLCKYHHHKQHPGYKPSESNMRILRRLWQEQGISDPSQKE